jgi:hypothetical protein
MKDGESYFIRAQNEVLCSYLPENLRNSGKYGTLVYVGRTGEMKQ